MRRRALLLRAAQPRTADLEIGDDGRFERQIREAMGSGARSSVVTDETANCLIC